MLDEPAAAAGPGISAVGGTALIVANCRARASRGTAPWFVDPLALHLAGRHRNWDSWSLSRGLLAWVAVRTRFLDELIADAVGTGIRQIVVLGAGLDARAFRLRVPATTRLFEIDRSDVLRFKEQAMQDAGVSPVCQRVVVPADLNDDDWVSALVASSWDHDAGTIWIAEGLMIYFEQLQREALLQDVQVLSSPGDVLGATMAARELAPEHPLWKPSPLRSPAAWFTACGWQAELRTMNDVGAEYGLPVSAPGRGLAQLIRAVPIDPGELR